MTPVKNDLAWRYFSELNGSAPELSRMPKTKFASGRGAPQQGRILPVASITMFLYSQWQVWPAFGVVPGAASPFHAVSYARAIVSASTLSGKAFQFSARSVPENHSKRRTPAFTAAGHISGSSHLTSKGSTTRN